MKRKSLLFSFMGLRLFLIFFKLAGGVHYALIGPLGERLMPVWLMGMIVSAGALIQMCLDIPAGRLLDKYGYRKVVIICTIAFAIGGALFLIKINILTIILSTAFATIGWLFASPGVNAYTLSHAPKENSEKFMAYRDVGWAIGIVLSCLVFPLLINKSNTAIGIWITGGFIVAIIAMFCAPRDTKKFSYSDHPHERTHHQRRHIIKELWTVIKKLNPASVIIIMLGLAGSIFYAVIRFVIPLQIAAHPEEGTMLGIGMSMFDFAVVVTGTMIAKFSKKFNRKLMIFIGLLLFGLMSVLSGMYAGILFLVAAFFATTGDELASLPLWSWLHQLDKNHANDGLLSGIINFFEDIGRTIGPLLGGLLYTYLGAQWTIVIGALPILIIAIIYYFAINKGSIHLALLEAPRKPRRLRHKN